MEIILVSCTITINENETLLDFYKRIINLLDALNSYPNETIIIAFPEYCWGEFIYDLIEPFLTEISKHIKKTSIGNNILIIFGSTVKDGQNRAIIHSVLDNRTEFISKVHVLTHEVENRHISSGNLPNVINWNNLNVAVIICADMWDPILINKLMKEKPDILVVPALTVVPKGLSNYARVQWHSLGITRSREYIIPIIISDHRNSSEYDVGDVSCIIDPSKKDDNMLSVRDFIETDDNNEIVIYKVDLNKIKQYRLYREKLGIINSK